jgi:hypothetical protein
MHAYQDRRFGDVATIEAQLRLMVGDEAGAYQGATQAKRLTTGHGSKASY